MQVSKAFIWSTIVTIAVIVVANIIATEYRIKREREEAAAQAKKLQCPPCPVCSGSET